MRTSSIIAGSLALACLLAARAQAAVTVGQAITAASDRLVSNQTGSGSWPDEPDFTGPIIAGLGQSTLVTGSDAYRLSTLSGANYVLSAANGNFLGDEAYGLTRASQLTPNPLSNTYRNALNTFYKTTIPSSTGGTNGYISSLVSAYTQAFGEQSQATFYVAEHTVAAAYVGAPDLSVWRQNLIGVLSQVDDNDFFPIQAAGVALWALAKTGPLDSTLITSASASSFWTGKTLADLPAIVAARQITTGTDAGGFYASFGTNTGGFTEDAVYAALGLSVANPALYQSQVVAAKNWLANGVIASGANQGMLADNPSNPTQVLNAYTGEGIQAMSASFPAVWSGATGNWSDAAQWNINPTVPDDNFTNGLFYDVTINGGAVTLDANRTIRFLNISSGSLTGAANLQLSGGNITGTYNVTGTTTVLEGTLIFGGTTQTAGGITGGGNLLVNAGATLTSDGITLPVVTINGAVRIRANGSATGTSKIATLSIAHTGSGSSSTYTGSLNLADNRLIIQATDIADKASKIASLNEAVLKGANGGAWNGPGISSSTAAADPVHLAVGIFDNDALGLAAIGGQPVDSNSILVAVAHLGDANRNGIVDIQDQSLVTNHWQSAQTNWAAGDLNLDGFVDLQDLTLVTNNWQQTSGFAANAGIAAGAAAPLFNTPEPASLLLLALGAGSLLIRRRPHR